MSKTIRKRILSVFLVVLLVLSIVPIPAFANEPEISIGDTIINELEEAATDANNSGNGPEISTAPNIEATPEPSPTPTPTPTDEAPPEVKTPKPPEVVAENGGDAPEESAVQEPEEQTQDEALAQTADGTALLDGMPVQFVDSKTFMPGRARATGTLSIHRCEGYQWDFARGGSPSDIRPWYMMTIDGRLAYCVEPTNRSTNSGGYYTVTWDGLSSAQRYTVAYAMLYGAQDMSNPLLHMATQVFIWEVTLGYMDLSTFTAVNKGVYNSVMDYNPEAADYYNYIISSIRSHSEVPTFTSRLQNAAPLHSVPGAPGEYALDLVNTNPRVSLSEFNFKDSGSVRFERENETLHVFSGEALDGNNLFSAYKGSLDDVQCLIFWGSGGDQIRATTGVLDPVPAHFRLTTKEAGPYSITIKKLQAGTNNPLTGAEFEVRHSEKGVVGTYTTDVSGVINISVPWQGTYIITEITPPKNHLISDNPVKDVVVSTAKPTAELTYHNEPFSGIQITKVDAATGQRIPGVTFRIAKKGGGQSQDIVTGSTGIATLPDLEPDWYTVTEISCPPGYILNPTPRTVEIISGEVCELVIENHKKPSLELTKLDADTGAGLPGATFRIAQKGGSKFVDITSGADGIARLTDLDPDVYTITEIKAPNGYVLDDTQHLIETKPGEILKITITNHKKPGLEITKVDEDTGEKLAGATFRVAQKGGSKFVDIVSGADGIARLTDLDPDVYTITEIKAPNGYVLDNTPQTAEIKSGEVFKITLTNKAKPSLEITKVDEDTGEKLAGAVFRVAKNGSKEFWDIESGADGIARLTGIDSGHYAITEITAPNGYILDSREHFIEVKEGTIATITLNNSKKPSLEILKIDSITKQPLAYATFKLSYKNGEEIGSFTSNEDGRIFLDSLMPGLIVIEEISAPDGYIITNTPQEVLLNGGDTKSVTFENTPKSPVIIKKVDAATGEPLPGAKFRLTKMNGELVGEYTTGRNGYVTIPELAPGWYIAVEIQAPDGYRLNDTPINIQLKLGDPAIVEFENSLLPGLQIRKIDEVSKEPLQSVTIRLAKINGEVIGDYKTNSAGLISIPDLAPGWYTAYETATIDGYILDTTPQNVELKDGKTATLEFTNKPLAGLTIIKTDSVTGEGLASVEFELSRLDGSTIGTYTTNEDGRLFVPGLKEGWIFAREVATLPGYVLDTQEQRIEIKAGEQNVFKFKNHPYPYLVIQKVDSETEKPIEGVKFRLYSDNGKEIGTYTTNANGRIVLTGIEAGHYQLQEVESAPGYLLDNRVWDITLEWGKTTTVRFKNILELGQIQIIKVAAEDNTLTGQKKGDKLEGAVFEIYNNKLEVVDTITTDKRGVATSKPLPLGKYTIQEVESPEYWLINDTVFEAEITKHEQVIRFEVENAAPKISVNVNKRGVAEAVTGTSIRYDFWDIENTSNVALDNFYWRDLLPTDAVRLETIYTGTWNERLEYKVVYKTNLKDKYTVLADGLLMTENHMLDCSPNALGLAANEYVSEFKFEFGTVQPGFKEVEAPFIFVKVLPELPNEYQFVNRTDVGGRYGEKWTYSKDAWVSVVYKNENKGKLPKTGV